MWNDSDSTSRREFVRALTDPVHSNRVRFSTGSNTDAHGLTGLVEDGYLQSLEHQVHDRDEMHLLGFLHVRA